MILYPVYTSKFLLFFPMFSFDPPENIKKPKVFWCFQGDQKKILGRTDFKFDIWTGLFAKRLISIIFQIYNTTSVMHLRCSSLAFKFNKKESIASLFQWNVLIFFRGRENGQSYQVFFWKVWKTSLQFLFLNNGATKQRNIYLNFANCSLPFISSRSRRSKKKVFWNLCRKPLSELIASNFAKKGAVTVNKYSQGKSTPQ